VGDRYGTSCASALLDRAVALLRGFGYSVGVNKPYAGGFITEHYGRPLKGLHALQIEVSRGLYMDEAALAPSAGFERVAADMRRFAAGLAALPPSLLPAPIPAE